MPRTRINVNLTRALLLRGVLFFASTDPRAEHLPDKTYTSADGLGSGSILSLVRDTRGFIWICSVRAMG